MSEGLHIQGRVARLAGRPTCPAEGLDPALRSIAATQLDTLLQGEGIARQVVYRPGEVCRLLRVTRPTMLALCALAEHPTAGRADPRALDSFRVGNHHRITHTALVDWLARNQTYQRTAINT